MSDLKPNFGRDGKVHVSIMRYILTLGGVSTSSGALRWLAAAVCMFFLGAKPTWSWPGCVGEAGFVTGADCVQAL